MKNTWYIVAMLLVTAWVVGHFGFGANGLIHILLVMAVMAFMMKVVEGKKL